MANVNSRYARAFADVVTAHKLDSEQVVQQVRGFVELLRDNAELRRVWGNPAIPAEQKRNLLDALVARVGTLKQVRNFLAVLIDHHRIDQLELIARAFERELNERLGMAEAQVVSARDLSAGEKRELERQVMNLTGKQVIASYAIDPKLLGGAVVKLGSTVYDGSVRGQLQRIKEQLSS